MRNCAILNPTRILQGSFILFIVLFHFVDASCIEYTVKQDGTGDFTTVQEALDAASSGDVVTVSGGSYVEDVSIGHFNVPSLKKDNITFRAAEGETVEIIAANTKNRAGGLTQAGFDPGPADRAGFVLNGDNALIEGIRFIQPSAELNNIDQALAVIVGSSNVTFRNCEIVGPSPDDGPASNTEGDLVGLAISPIDVFALSQGTGVPPTNLTMENCRFHHVEFGFGTEDMLKTGLPPETTLRNCEFYYNRNGVEVNDGTVHLFDCNIHDNSVGVQAADDQAFLTNCVIWNNGRHGVQLDEGEIDAVESAQNPTVVIDQCEIRDNGLDNEGAGIQMELGTLTVKNTVLSNNVNGQVFISSSNKGDSTVTIDHCDLYESIMGFAIATTEDLISLADITITNSILVDEIGVMNNMGVLAEFTVEYCDFFVTDEPFVGASIVSNTILNIAPGYVDAESGDFYLTPDSPLTTAAQDGEYIGSKGVKTPVVNWMVH